MTGVQTCALPIYPDQPRGEDGKWIDGGGGGSGGTELRVEDLRSGFDDSLYHGRDFAAAVGEELAKDWNPSSETLALYNKEEKTSLDKTQVVQNLMMEWTGSSGGPVHRAMISGVTSDVTPSSWFEKHPQALEDFRNLGRAMYNNTQEYLREKGIKEVVLYRKGRANDSELPVTSWSVSSNGFITTDSSRISRKETIPASHILSLANTGFGNIVEGEAVVLRSINNKTKGKKLARFAFNPDQPRGEDGKWIDGGGGGYAALNTSGLPTAISPVAQLREKEWVDWLERSSLKEGLNKIKGQFASEQVYSEIKQAAYDPALLTTEDKTLYFGTPAQPNESGELVFGGARPMTTDISRASRYGAPIEVHVPKGTRLLAITPFGEPEYVLLMGSRLRVGKNNVAVVVDEIGRAHV